MPRPARYTGIADALRAQLRDGLYALAEPLPTEQELAAQFGVNRLTLRKALAVLEQEGLVLRRHGCGTFPQPGIGTAGLHTVLYAGETTTHFYEGFYSALCAEARKRGMAVTAYTPGEDADRGRFMALLREHGRLVCMEELWRRIRADIPDGVHVTRVSGYHSIHALEAHARRGYVISSDLSRASARAVEFLVAAGHRRIALLDVGCTAEADSLLGQVNARHDVVQGYRSALQENGIGEEWPMIVPDDPDTTDWQEHESRSVRRHLETWNELPTAIVSAYDFRAAPLLCVLRDKQLRVPEDVSVIGIGNTPWAETLDPPLTSVCLGEAEMARLALMLNMEEEPDAARLVRVEPELVVRRSTAAVEA